MAKHSFTPVPIVGAAKILVFAVILSTIILLLRDFIDFVNDLYFDILMIIGLIVVIRIVFLFIMARFHVVTLDDNTISYHHGIIATKRIILPYPRITEASYTQGIIQRLFGVGTLRLDTAGGSIVAIKVDDIKKSDLEMILGDVNAKCHKDDAE